MDPDTAGLGRPVLTSASLRIVLAALLTQAGCIQGLKAELYNAGQASLTVSASSGERCILPPGQTCEFWAELFTIGQGSSLWRYEFVLLDANAEARYSEPRGFMKRVVRLTFESNGLIFAIKRGVPWLSPPAEQPPGYPLRPRDRPRSDGRPSS